MELFPVVGVVVAAAIAGAVGLRRATQGRAMDRSFEVLKAFPDRAVARRILTRGVSPASVATWGQVVPDAPAHEGNEQISA
jgi:hypothetical protein